MSASTAEWVGLIRGPALADGDALDAMRARVLRSNLCHAADSYGQVRVCWSAMPSLDVDPIAFTVDATELRLVKSFGPWPAPLRHDGRPFALRVAVALHMTSGELDVYALYGPARAPDALVNLTAWGDAADSWTGETATNAAWISDGRLLRMSAAQARDCRVVASTVDHEGDPAAVEQTMVALHIYARGTAVNPYLDGVYASEWQGDVT